ncbi:MAG: hypothetical protein IJ751_06870 [Oscillospiraceae bacterium]|nr:hypothetical protein [Oscillospiraceae bacterium]
MSIPSSDYYEYRERIEDIVKYGTKEALERLYREIRAKYGDDEDLHRLDSMYNHKWRIL